MFRQSINHHCLLKNILPRIKQNLEILDKMTKKWKLWKYIQSGRDKVIRHILRHESFQNTIVKRHIGRGWPKAEYITGNHEGYKLKTIYRPERIERSIEKHG